jgi:hypothetical protein
VVVVSDRRYSTMVRPFALGRNEPIAPTSVQAVELTPEDSRVL